MITEDTETRISEYLDIVERSAVEFMERPQILKSSAKLIRAYYEALLEVGFDRQAALQIASGYNPSGVK